eukprot:scaffold155122_cov19-Tisochrysis_lutea.AAC.1
MPLQEPELQQLFGAPRRPNRREKVCTLVIVRDVVSTSSPRASAAPHTSHYILLAARMGLTQPIIS